MSGEVCWRVGEGCGDRNGGGIGKCVRVWDPNTLPSTLPHISSLTSPFPTSPLTSPIPQHTFLHLLSYLFPHLPPHPNTLSYTYLPHLLKVWQSYHVTKFLWRSYYVAKLLATVHTSIIYSILQIKPNKNCILQGTKLMPAHWFETN